MDSSDDDWIPVGNTTDQQHSADNQQDAAGSAPDQQEAAPLQLSPLRGGGPRLASHLGIGSLSSDTAFEKVQFNAHVPASITFPPLPPQADGGARGIDLPPSAEWSRQSAMFVSTSPGNPKPGSPQDLAVLILRSGMSLHASVLFLAEIQQHLRNKGSVVKLECANLQYIQRKLRETIRKYAGIAHVKVPMPHPTLERPMLSLTYRYAMMPPSRCPNGPFPTFAAMSPCLLMTTRQYSGSRKKCVCARRRSYACPPQTHALTGKQGTQAQLFTQRHVL